jgi:hypothetical protein
VLVGAEEKATVVVAAPVLAQATVLSTGDAILSFCGTSHFNFPRANQQSALQRVAGTGTATTRSIPNFPTAGCSGVLDDDVVVTNGHFSDFGKPGLLAFDATTLEVVAERRVPLEAFGPGAPQAAQNVTGPDMLAKRSDGALVFTESAGGRLAGA